MSTHTLVLIRHGQSTYNQERRFTGWADAPLSEQGIKEARAAGRILRQEGHTFDLAFTTYLKRAIKTLWLVLEAMDLMWIPVHKNWWLNERHYGALQGVMKEDAEAEYGEDQIRLWRFGYDFRPPRIALDDKTHPRFDRRYASLRPEQLPASESLGDLAERMIPCWKSTIVPEIKSGQNVLIVAHANTLRTLVKHLDSLSNDEIFDVKIPTGTPLIYELEDGAGFDLHSVRRFWLETETSLGGDKKGGRKQEMNWAKKR